MKRFKKHIVLITLASLTAGCGPKWSESEQSGFNLVTNDGGKTIAYSPASGVKILTVDRYGFKDLNQNNQLDAYEDWRLSTDERAADLASKMTLEQIAGLMLYSAHQSIPARPSGYFAGTYNGKSFKESSAKASDLTDQQKSFLEKDNLRHVLFTTVQSSSIAAEWNNNIQAFSESLPPGIPANNSSDPRYGTISSAEYDAGAGNTNSMWPSHLGMAATFDPNLVERFGEIVSQEYRALGITTALSAQVDISTDPRWARANGTFGENPYLSTAMAQAYTNGFQTSTGTKEISDGWGYASVNSMVKHWPGGSSGEGGRDAHYAMGKYAVYPGDSFDKHLIPFIDGAFKLNGKTKMASAVMPYYTISWEQTPNEQVGNSYSKYIIKDLLRTKYNYDGVICTDWGITADHNAMDKFIDGKPWGAEGLSVAERHYKILMAGVDQFGGNNDAKPIMEAYAMGVKELGEDVMRTRMEQSAVRLLRNIFQVGLFENPYLIPEETANVVGNPDFVKEGFEAQLKSIVMLKNKQSILPLEKHNTVYVPKRYRPASRNFLGMEIPETTEYPISMTILEKYFKLTDNPDDADYALVFVENPKTGIGYNAEDIKNGGNGYFPISLQYGEYTAVDAREVSIAGGDPLEEFINRSYKNKTVTASNISDLAMIKETSAKMKGKPVIVSIAADNPMVFSEFEDLADAILISFRVQDQAVLDIMTGMQEPSGMLPIQMPASMSTVEKQAEDTPHDMNCHEDSEGNKYDFGFGLNWSGVIKDERSSIYTRGK